MKTFVRTNILLIWHNNRNSRDFSKLHCIILAIMIYSHLLPTRSSQNVRWSVRYGNQNNPSTGISKHLPEPWKEFSTAHKIQLVLWNFVGWFARYLITLHQIHVTKRGPKKYLGLLPTQTLHLATRTYAQLIVPLCLSTISWRCIRDYWQSSTHSTWNWVASFTFWPLYHSRMRMDVIREWYGHSSEGKKSILIGNRILVAHTLTSHLNDRAIPT